MRLGLFYLLALIFSVNILYQNCSQESDVNFNSFKKNSISSVTVHQGNGDSFDGKPMPGDYLRTFSATECVNNNILVQSVMRVESEVATINVDDCVPTSFPISFNNPALSVKKYNPDFLTYYSGIFEKSTAVAANEFSETFCRSKTSDVGIDIVIKNNKVSNQREGILYLGQIINNEVYTEKTPRILVNRGQSAGQTSYVATTDALELFVNDSSYNGVVFSGTLKTIIKEQSYNVSLDCLRMHERPVLSLSPMGLLGYWQLDEVGAVDGSIISAAFGPNGILSSSDLLTKSIAGQFGGALNFDGADDFVRLATAPGSFDVQSEISITGWFNRASVGTDDIIISKRGERVGVAGFPGYEIHINNGNDRLMFIIDDNINVYSLQSVASFTVPGWNHFTVVYDRQNAGDCRVYINGIDDSGQAMGVPTSLTPVSNNLDLVLGAMSSSGHNFDGALDDLSVWNRKLTAEEVRIIFQRSGPLFP